MIDSSANAALKRSRSLIFGVLFLLMFPLLAQQVPTPSSPAPLKNSVPGKVYLLYADSLLFNKKISPDYQVLKGNVQFRRDSMFMFCDSAYFYEATNSFDAFGSVRMEQGDTLFVYSDVLYYDGNTELARLRENVRLVNREVTLYADSLNYDQQINVGYYFEGGKIVDSENELTSLYGQYSPDTKQSVFQYDVVLTNPRFRLTSDTLEYNTASKIADILGPSVIVSDSNTIYSSLGWYDTNSEQSMLLDRSVVVSGQQKLTGDTIFYNRASGFGEVFGNMQLNDTVRQIILEGQYGYYDERTECALATDSALVIEYKGIDTFFLHADTLKMFNDTLRKQLPELAAYAIPAEPALPAAVPDSGAVTSDSLSSLLSDSLGAIRPDTLSGLDALFARFSSDTLVVAADTLQATAVVDSSGILAVTTETAVLPADTLVTAANRAIASSGTVPPPGPEPPLPEPVPVVPRETLPLAATVFRPLSFEAPSDSVRLGSITLAVFRPDTILAGIVPDSLLQLSTAGDSVQWTLFPAPPPGSLGLPQRSDSISRVMIAYYGVRFIRGLSQGVCDSLSYVQRDSVMHMYRNPVLWNNNQQVFGDSIRIYLNDSTIDWVHIPTGSFSARELDSLYFDQLSGTELKAYFENGDVRRVNVSGNLEIIYYPENRDSTRIGLCNIVSSQMTMFLKRQQMERMILSPQSQGVLTPLSQVTSNMLFLPRYVWYDYRRPKSRWDLYTNVAPRPGEDHSGGGDFFEDE